MTWRVNLRAQKGCAETISANVLKNPVLNFLKETHHFGKHLKNCLKRTFWNQNTLISKIFNLNVYYDRWRMRMGGSRTNFKTNSFISAFGTVLLRSIIFSLVFPIEVVSNKQDHSTTAWNKIAPGTKKLLILSVFEPEYNCLNSLLSFYAFPMW